MNPYSPSAERRKTIGTYLPFPPTHLVLALSLATGAMTYAQNSQSPIDITAGASVYNPSLPALNFSYTSTTLSVINNGSPGEESTIRGNVPTLAGILAVSGVNYELKQFHFHTESEHLLNGSARAMEMHLVHQDSGGNYLVVARHIEPGAENAALSPIFSALPPTSAAPPLTVENFDLGELLPSSLTSFRYDGSLTTSPYTEPVKWVFLSENMELSTAQIDAFRELFDGPHGNFRDVQDLNGRTIQTDLPGFAVPEPNGLALLLVGFGVFAGFRRFQTNVPPGI